MGCGGGSGRALEQIDQRYHLCLNSRTCARNGSACRVGGGWQSQTRASLFASLEGPGSRRHTGSNRGCGKYGSGLCTETESGVSEEN
eukprot:3998199-Pleurochrysis_carterae.AAC.3